MKSRRVLALISSVAVFVLAACASGDREGVGTVGAPVGQGQPAAVPLVEEDQQPSSLRDGCAAARALRILQAPGPDEEEPEEVSTAQDQDSLEVAVGAALSDDLATRWDWLLEVAEDAYSDPDLVTEDIEAEVFDSFESIVRALGESCRDQGPFWGCAVTDQSFATVNNGFTTVDEIDDPSPPAGPAQSAEPRALAEEIDQSGDLVLLSDDQAHLYGWVDDAGRVVRSLEVVPVTGGWSRGTDTRCIAPEELAAAAEEKFETVGEAIESSDVTASAPSPEQGMIKSPDDGKWVVPYETLYGSSGAPYTYDQGGYHLSMDECYWYGEQGDDRLDQWCEEYIYE